MISGPRRSAELVAVAEIESGSIAIASTIPSETIERAIASRLRRIPPQPPQRADLDQVVKAKRQHDPTRRRRSDRREAARLIGTRIARKQSPPAARAEHEADEITDSGSNHQQQAGVRKRPTRAGQLPAEQNTHKDGDHRKDRSAEDPAVLRRPVDRYPQTVADVCHTAAARRRLTSPTGLQSSAPHMGQRGNGGSVAI